jgi:hypothetical protein
MSRFVAGLVVGALTLVGASQAMAESRHSGTVTALGARGETIEIDELGPSRSAEPASTRLTVALTPRTKVELAVRTDQNRRVATADWPGGYRETPASAQDIRPGDFVTVITEERDGRTVATNVSVVRPESEPSASPGLRDSAPPSASPRMKQSPSMTGSEKAPK